MSKLPWVVAGVAAVALLVVLARPRAGIAAGHPEPRPGITAERVLPPGMVPEGAGTLEAYEAARRVPQVLDGIYCHCNCSKSIGHRSLLTCFESDHGAYCDICMGEAMLAEKMHGSGNSLQQIRKAIDAQFGS
jgi:Protein of unknown function with PCYCGC motif